MFFAGLTVTLGNPKIMVFYLALLPTIIDLNRVSFIGWAELCLTALAVMAIVDLGYVVLAARARLLLATRKPCVSSIAARRRPWAGRRSPSRRADARRGKRLLPKQDACALVRP